MKLCLYMLCFMIAGSASGQIKMSGSGEKEKEGNDARKQQAPFDIVGPILEGTIDPELYSVGPDDQFLISIWGQVNESFAALITPEGLIAIPSVKTIDIRDMKLRDAKAKIASEMKKVYPNAEISVSLLRLRTFRVLLAGFVANTATIDASGADRVSTCIQKAGGTNHGSMRNIRINRRSGELARADLIRRDRTGSLLWDPFVLEGDQIYVPPVYTSFSTFGPVSLPGVLEFVSGERISDAIELSGGMAYGADSSAAEIVRMNKDSGREALTITLNLKAILERPADTLNNIRIMPDDRIFFKRKARFHEKASVTITGELMIPGVYSIIEDETKVTDVITRAGGFTPNVSLDRIVIYRNPEGSDQEFERLKATPISDMNDIEKSYFKAKVKQINPTVQTDFKKLYAGGKINPDYDVFLRDGDRIMVASLKRTVTVVGGAVLSGIVDWVPGKGYGYYVEKSGGYTSKAKRGDVRIIKASTQKWMDADGDVNIEDGDVIFIPEKEPIKGWEIFKDAIAITGQLAAITATVILIIFSVKK